MYLNNLYLSFTKTDLYWIIPVIVVGLIVLALAIFFVLKNNKKRHQKEIVEQEVQEKIKTIYDSVILYCGGKENIKEVTHSGSRVTVKIENSEKINSDELGNIDTQVLSLQDKIILVIGSEAGNFANELNKTINN